MEVVKLFIQIVVAGLSGLAALMSILFFLQLRWPAPRLWIIKLYTSALSPFLLLVGLLTTFVGLIEGSALISIVGVYNVLIFLNHIFRITRPPNFSRLEHAIRLNWEVLINQSQEKQFLSQPTVLRSPKVASPRMEQSIVYATVPGTQRQLLCDVWQPPATITPSGLAFIYLHGGAWYLLDKDLGTRPFFSHLAAQGHVIMDVAYRLAPETDLMGMVHDVKRAIAWMKENASDYKVNPNRVVVGGGSAGGHLALLTTYTANDPQFTPKELEGKDSSACAVISLYGPSDLDAMYYHLNQHLTTRSVPGKPKKSVPTKMPEWMVRKMGNEYYRLGFDKGLANAGAFAPLLGGHPDECPERYDLFSPVTHVHSHCPPTLLIHGEDDTMAPVQSTRDLYSLLVEKNVPTVLHILPQTDHAFDLILPKISLSAHNAWNDVGRFLGLFKSSTNSNQLYETADSIWHHRRSNP